MVISTAAAATAAKFIATKAVKLVAVRGVKRAVRRVVTKSGRRVATKKTAQVSAREIARRHSVSADRLLRSKGTVLSRANSSSKIAARHIDSPAAKRLSVHKLKTQLSSVRDDLRAAANKLDEIASSANKALGDPRVQKARQVVGNLNRVANLVSRAGDLVRSQETGSVADVLSAVSSQSVPQGSTRVTEVPMPALDMTACMELAVVHEPELVADVEVVRSLTVEVSSLIVELRVGLTAVEVSGVETASAVALEELSMLEVWAGAGLSADYACAG